MICRNCNAQIDDNSLQCPFCQAPTTMNVDPGQPAPQQGYGQPYGQVPPPQNMGYGTPQPTPVPSYGMPEPVNEYDKRANTSMVMGILGLVSNFIGLVGLFCCCMFIPQIAAIVFGIIAMVKASKLKPDLYLLSETGKKKRSAGNIMGIISLILGIIGLLLLCAMMVLGIMGSLDYDNLGEFGEMLEDIMDELS